MPAVLVPLMPVILQALAGLVVAGLGWLTLTVKNKMNAQSAWAKLAEIAVALAGRAWDRLGPVVQTALVDGKITADERAQIEATAKAVLAEVADEKTLEDVAKAVGLPVPGIIAWLASQFIDRWVAAHDVARTDVSAGAYPSPAMLAATGSDPAEAGARAAQGG